MQKLFKELLARLNGSRLRSLIAFNNYKNRGSEVQFYQIIVYRKMLMDFFFGRLSKNYLINELEMEKQKIAKQFLNNEINDFGLFKITKTTPSNRQHHINEASDLIFPYMANAPQLYNECRVGEGTYENFGVFVNEGDVVMDCGANIGFFSLFSAYKKASKVISFEPLKVTYDQLKKNIAINNFETEFITEKLGVSNKNEQIKISFNKDHTGESSIIRDVGKGTAELINVVSIDDYVKDKKIEQLDFIKADIEGAERLMLDGARETIRRFKPKLAICTYHLPDDKEVLTKIIMEANKDYEIYYGKAKLFAL